MKFVFIFLSFLTILSSKPLDKVSLQLQYFHQFQFAGYYMAKEKGFYKEAGFELEFKEFSVGVDPVEEVVSKRATFAIGRSALIAQKSKGKKLVALAAILQSTPSVIMTKKSSGINKIEDFKGKKINIIGTEYSDSVHALLRSKNVNFSDMKVEKSSDRFEKIVNDKVDIITGYTSNQPFMFKQLGIDINIFDPKDYGFDFYSEILYTHEDEIKKNQQRVYDFVNASLKGWEYAFENIEETVGLILQKYNTQNKSKEALLYEAKVLKELAYLNTDELGHIQESKIRKTYAMYSVMGLIEKPVDMERFIYHHDKHRKMFLLENAEKEYIKNKKVLSVCVAPELLPYGFMDKEKFIGISADYLNVISKKLSLELEIISAKNRDENIELLKDKRCDIKPVMLPHSEKIIPYTNTKPYIEDYFTLTTRIDEPFMMNLDNRLDKKYALLKSHHLLKNTIKNRYPSIKLVYVDDVKKAMDMVIKGEVFGYLGTSLSSIYYIQNFFNSKLKISNDFGSFKIGFGVVDDDSTLLSILNKSIDSLSNLQKKDILNNWVNMHGHTHIDYTFIWRLFIVFVIILTIVLIFLIREYRLKKLILEQKNTFENLFQKSSDGVLLIRDNKFYECNEAVVKMLGYNSKEEFLNTHPADLSPMFQADGRLSMEKSLEMDSIAYEKGSNSFEWLHRKANGKVFWVEVVLTKINIKGEDILHVTWRDIHRKKELEEELLNINKDLKTRVKREVEKNIEKDKQLLQKSKLAQMGEMVSMIAHQWRQPLGAIASTVVNMKFKIMMHGFDFTDTKDVKEAEKFFNDGLDDIDSYVQSLTHIIDDFRDFYKPNSKVVKSKIDIVINKATKMIANSLRDSRVDVRKEFKSKADVNIFQSEMMQVVLNILQNAKDNFKERDIENPVIIIKTYDTDERVVVEICDNGGGIPEDIMQNIFDPYFSTKDEKNGTGLGLYMSKMIVEEHHHGELDAFNRDEGVYFKIELPKN